MNKPKNNPMHSMLAITPLYLTQRMEVRRPMPSFYPLSLFYMYIDFVGSLDREEFMHWCKIINHRIQVLV